MSPSTPRPKPRRSCVAAEEERAWIGFYRRVAVDAALATEVLVQLDADAEMKRTHLALYLSCREALRTHAEREQRHARIGAFVRRVAHGLFVALPQAIGRKLKRGGDIAVACLPEADAEPAPAQVRRLVAEPEFDAARTAFVSAATPTSASARTAEPTSADPPLARAGG
jgi:hypothetical protein